MEEMTPGPWSVNDDPRFEGGKPAFVWGPGGPGKGPVCELFALYPRDFNAADARLIAAAPELLAALKEWVAFADRIMGDLEDGDPLKQAILDTHGARTERSRAAIAKAEGRT